MLIFPAIDIIDGKAVRLYQGDYDRKTVYNENPVNVALEFKNSGASCIHIVDLDGAKEGNNPNLDLICRIKKETGLFCEVGGGIRDFNAIEKYLNQGIDRVILGTIAAKEPDFVKEAVNKYGEAIAVGIDVKNNKVAIKGWTEESEYDTDTFIELMQSFGVDNVICTDISKDGAMEGTNRNLYKHLSENYKIKITASGGVSSLDDVRTLAGYNLYAAIIGRAYYMGAVDLKTAIEVAK